MTSPTNNSDPDVISDYTGFIDHQINSLLDEEKNKNKELSQLDELKIAINFCKNYLSDTSNSSDDAKRVEVVNKLVELRLELVQLEVRIDLSNYIPL
jgi:hypothetical protein